MKVPMTLPRAVFSQYFFASAAWPRNTLPIWRTGTTSARREPTTQRSTSPTANMPIIAGMKLTPPRSSMLPKVKRGWPAVTSMPTVATSRPTSRETIPLIGEPVEMNAAQVRPKQASQKYS